MKMSEIRPGDTVRVVRAVDKAGVWTELSKPFTVRTVKVAPAGCRSSVHVNETDCWPMGMEAVLQ